MMYLLTLGFILFLIISVIAGTTCVVSASRQGRVTSPLSEVDKVSYEEFNKPYEDLNKKQKKEVYNILPTKDDLEWDRRERSKG